MKVKKQKLKLAVRKFNFEGGCLRRKHGELFPDSIRCLIVGPSNCGKSNVMLTLLLDRNGVRFENVYLFSKSVQQSKYSFLEKVLREIKGVNFYAYKDLNLKPGEVKKNSIVIFDDVITDKQSPIADFFSMGRHRDLDCFYLGQTYSRIPKQLIRDNSNVIVLFKMDTLNLKHAYNDHVVTDMDFSKFKEICDVCWKKPYGFIVVDKDSAKNNGRYRIGFDSYISV